MDPNVVFDEYVSPPKLTKSCPLRRTRKFQDLRSRGHFLETKPRGCQEARPRGSESRGWERLGEGFGGWEEGRKRSRTIPARRLRSEDSSQSTPDICELSSDSDSISPVKPVSSPRIQVPKPTGKRLAESVPRKRQKQQLEKKDNKRRMVYPSARFQKFKNPFESDSEEKIEVIEIDVTSPVKEVERVRRISISKSSENLESVAECELERSASITDIARRTPKPLGVRNTEVDKHTPSNTNTEHLQSTGSNAKRKTKQIDRLSRTPSIRKVAESKTPSSTRVKSSESKTPSTLLRGMNLGEDFSDDSDAPVDEVGEFSDAEGPGNEVENVARDEVGSPELRPSQEVEEYLSSSQEAGDEVGEKGDSGPEEACEIDSLSQSPGSKSEKVRGSDMLRSADLKTPVKPRQISEEGSAQKGRRRKYLKGGMAEQLHKLLLRQKSTERFHLHQQDSQKGTSSVRKLVLQILSFHHSRSLTVIRGRVLRTSERDLDGEVTIMVNKTRADQLQLDRGGSVVVLPPWHRLEVSAESSVLLCTLSSAVVTLDQLNSQSSQSQDM